MVAKLRPINKKEDFKSVAKINGAVQNFPWSGEAIRKEFENAFFRGWVAESKMGSKMEVVGYLLLRHNENEAEIMTLGVITEFQRNGIGQQLILEAVKSLPTSSFVILEVSHLNEGALSLYKKMGFEIFSTRKNYYPDGSDAVCMKLNIAKA